MPPYNNLGAMLLFIIGSRAEEASILTSATVIDNNIKYILCRDPQVLINGTFKTFCVEEVTAAGNVEYIIDLSKSMTIHTVYINNRYFSR